VTSSTLGEFGFRLGIGPVAWMDRVNPLTVKELVALEVMRPPDKKSSYGISALGIATSLRRPRLTAGRASKPKDTLLVPGVNYLELSATTILSGAVER